MTLISSANVQDMALFLVYSNNCFQFPLRLLPTVKNNSIFLLLFLVFLFSTQYILSVGGMAK